MISKVFDERLISALRSCRSFEEWQNICDKWQDEDGSIDTVLDAKHFVECVWSRMKRCRRRIAEFLSYFSHTYFVTFTIDGAHINRVNKEYLPRKAKDVLRLVDDCEYILNEDWGDLHGRYHLHCVLATDYLKLNVLEFLTKLPESWHYGAVKVQVVHRSEKDVLRLRNYITKLVRHAYKGSTGRMWYSRCNYDVRNRYLNKPVDNIFDL